jgi:hypothetical protein
LSASIIVMSLGTWRTWDHLGNPNQLKNLLVNRNPGTD